MYIIQRRIYYSVVTTNVVSITVLTQTTTATLTPSPTYDAYRLTAQDQTITIANPSPDYDDFEVFMISIVGTGAETINFGNKFRGFGSALPITTTAGKVMDITCRRDASADKYDVKYSEEV